MLPFTTHPFTLSLLQRPEYLANRSSKACGEPVQWLAAGNIAARKQDIATAQELFTKALASDPSLAIDPQADAKRIAATMLVQESSILSLQGDPEGAAAKLTAARIMQPQIEIDAELQTLATQLLRHSRQALTENNIVSATLKLDTLTTLYQTFGAAALDEATKTTAAKRYVRLGEALAREGQTEQATTLFAQALLFDPSLSFDPGTQAKTLAAETLLKRGRKLAESLQVEEAIKTLTTALALNPKLGIDPKTEAETVAAQTYLAQGQEFARQGDATQATEALNQALALDPSLPIKPAAEMTRLAPTPTPPASPLATPTPVSPVSPLSTPAATATKEP